MPRLAAAMLLLLAGSTTGLLAAAAGAEVYLRWTKPWGVCAQVGPGERPNAVPGVSWAVVHPELGWVSSSADGPVNRQGFRDPHDLDAVPIVAERRRLMVLGDSFMWGAGVGADESVPARLQHELGSGWDVFNVSAPGWGVDQMYLAYLHYRDAIRPDVVMLAFIDEDIDRVLDAFRPHEGMNKPSFTVRNGELMLRTSGETAGMLAALASRSAALRCSKREIDRTVKARRIAGALFRALAAETEGRGEQLVVVRIPHREAIDSSVGRLLWGMRRFRSLAEDARVAYVELASAVAQSGKPTSELYLDDGHMNAAGSALLAASLAPALRNGVGRRADGADPRRPLSDALAGAKASVPTFAPVPRTKKQREALPMRALTSAERFAWEESNGPGASTQ